MSPHGFRPLKGSRFWIDDRGWMLFFVNFESSAFAKGSRLDIGAHFLWSAADHVSFDIVRRIEGFHPFENQDPIREGRRQAGAKGR